MHSVVVEGPLDVPAEAAWAVLGDFASAQCYHPRVATSRITGQTGAGLGAQRRCELVDGEVITETIVAYAEGRGYTTEVRGLNKPLKRVFGQVELWPGGRGCRVRLSVTFEPRFGPLGWALSILLMKPMMRRQLRQTLQALDHYLRTGRKWARDAETGVAEPGSRSGPTATSLKTT